ncbi:MAG: class I SAM-dependent rRNA methyltransferase [Myxococcales bacterium]|nr:class I SAM-dependent rRNA methyltransferase [Myxococcales bacterium]
MADKSRGRKSGGRKDWRGHKQAQRRGRGKSRGPKLPVPENLPRYTNAWSVVLTPNTVNLATAGHPWLFGGAIAHSMPPTVREPSAGQVCAIFGPEGEYIGHGYHNADSQIRVRVMSLGDAENPPQSLPELGDRVVVGLNRATQLRTALGLPRGNTDAYRLVNSEGDGLPGLVIDRVGNGAVVLLSTAGAARMSDAAVAWLTSHGCEWVVVRTAGDTHPSEGLSPGVQRLEGQVPDSIWHLHHGIKMRAEPKFGQKSGIYTDQFSNHIAVAKLARGLRVLDCYSHGGGFGLHAAKAGAKHVRCVDASQGAVELVMANAEANEVSDKVEAWCGDAVHVLRDYAEGTDPNGPDLIIVDPPKFATRADVIDDALRKYVHLNATAMSALPPQGYLVSCSCSGRIDQQTFLRMLAHAGRKSGRNVQVLEVRGAAADHPGGPAHDESRYLKVAICRITDRI